MLKKVFTWMRSKNVSNKHKHNSDCFTEGELWWCNVKDGDSFVTRLVLVFEKLTDGSFLGVPMTNKERTEKFIEFDDKVLVADLSRVRSFHVKQIVNKLGSLTVGDFEKVRRGMNDWSSL